LGVDELLTHDLAVSGAMLIPAVTSSLGPVIRFFLNRSTSPMAELSINVALSDEGRQAL
jgi:hypothetical protein